MITSLRQHLRTRLLRNGHIGLAVLVLAFSAALIALMWVALEQQFSYEHNRATEVGQTESANLAQLFEELTLRTLGTAGVVLKEMEEEYRHNGRKFDLDRHFREHQAELAPFGTLAVIDENGKLVLSSVPAATPQNFRNTDNYQFNQHDTARNVFVSKPQIKVLTGKPTVYLSRRVNKADGSFGGYAEISIAPAYFSNVYGEIALGDNAVVLLVGSDGVVRARHSLSDAEVGQDLSRTPLFETCLRQGAKGHFLGKDAFDGVARFFSCRAVRGYPLIVLVGTSQASLFAPFEERNTRGRWLAGAITAVILAFAALVMFQLSRQTRTDKRRRESDERFRMLITVVQDYAIFMLDLQGRVITWNAGAERIMDYRAEDILGKSSVVFYTSEDAWAGQPRSLLKIAEEKGRVENECRLVRKNGSVFLAAQSITAMRDPDETLRGYSNVVRDVTERKKSDHKLKENQSLLSGMIDAAMDAIIIIDANHNIVLFNRTAEQVFGYTASEIIGHPLARLLPQRFQAAHEKHIEAYAIAGKTARHMKQLGTVFGMRSTGEEFPIEAAISWTETITGKKQCAVVLRDITERKRIEQQLRDLTLSLQQTQEEERAHIARDLHDDLGACLSVLKSQLCRMQDRAGNESPQADEIELAIRLTDMVLEASDRIVRGLWPVVLEHFGLIAAIETLIKDVAKRSGLKITADLQPATADLDRDREITLYRGLQECLTNVTKHANATRVQVTLKLMGDNIVLGIQDNGRGLAVPEDAWTGRYGIAGLRERLHHIGGDLHISSADAGGVIVIIQVTKGTHVLGQEDLCHV